MPTPAAIVRMLRRLGPVNAVLLGITRTAWRMTSGRVRIYRYYFVAQPVSAPQLPSRSTILIRRVEPGDLQDFAVDVVVGGDLHVAPLFAGLLVRGQQRGQPLAVQRFGVVQIEHDLPWRDVGHKALEGVGLVGAQLLGRMHDHHVAENFARQLHRHDSPKVGRIFNPSEP